MTDATPAAGSPGGVTLEFEQTATARSIFGIAVVNALLNIVTLTLWRFWGRTRVRQHLWAHTTINGEALEYTGKGSELFKSFLFVVFAFIVPFYALTFGITFIGGEVLTAVFGAFLLVLYPFIFWLLGMAIYLAQRYRLSRTTWRGVRFGLPGSAKGYGWAFLGYLLLTLITFGWFGPAMETRLARRQWGEATYGDKPFGFSTPDGKGPSGGLYGPFALAWFGGFLALAAGAGVGFALGQALGVDFTTAPAPGDIRFVAVIYGAILTYAVLATVLAMGYYAALIRRIVSCLTLGDVRFSHRATALGLLWLYGGNLLILLFTLGLGLPFTQVRVFRFMVHRLEAEGALDLATINQNPDAGPAIGEGLADAFDFGTI